MAKSRNDRTSVHIKSPLEDSKMAEMAGGAGGNDMLKKMASSFLSKDTTVVEYDMNQAKSMQTSIIITMIVTWVLHFKMQQVQPLLITTINNLLQLVYNPLFQVYVLGRNLERPFVTPKPEWVKKAEEAAKAAAEAKESMEEENDVEVEVTIEEVDADDDDGSQHDSEETDGVDNEEEDESD